MTTLEFQNGLFSLVRIFLLHSFCTISIFTTSDKIMSFSNASKNWPNFRSECANPLALLVFNSFLLFLNSVLDQTSQKLSSQIVLSLAMTFSI